MNINSKNKERIKSFFIGCFGLAITVCIGEAHLSSIIDARQLSQHGKATIAQVGKKTYKTYRRKGRSYFHSYTSIYYDGHRTELRLGNNISKRLRVIYLPEKPHILALGDSTTTFWQIYTQDFSTGRIVLDAVVFLITAFGTWGFFEETFTVTH